MPSQEPIRTLRLLNVEQGLEETEQDLLQRSVELAGLERGDLRGFRIAQRSVDARRRRGPIRFVCHVELMVGRGVRSRRLQRLLDKGGAKEAPRRGSL